MNSNLNFTALDFETATSEHNSICQVGIVVVKHGNVIRKFSSLIQPPENEYAYNNVLVHGIESTITADAPLFSEIWEEIAPYIIDQHIVCHNAAFDILKLEKTLEYYNIPFPNFTYACTFEIFQGKLENCCAEQNIEFLCHHDALSDAEACARLYLRYLKNEGFLIPNSSNIPFSFKKIEKDDLLPDFEKANINSPFYKKKVVFTGDLINYSRQEAAHILKELGADVNTAISRKTDMVIIGRNPGPSKIEKIQEFGIPIISEDDFLKMVE